MSPRKLLLPAMLGTLLLSALPAGAQYYDPYRRPPPSYDDDYERPAPPYGYGYGQGRRHYRPAYGNLCVTGRGDCPLPGRHPPENFMSSDSDSGEKAETHKAKMQPRADAPPGIETDGQGNVRQ